MVPREIERNAADIVFLQETYCTGYYGDSPIRRAKGVAIGFGKNVYFIVAERKFDPDGRFLFLRGTLLDTKYTFANVYCPSGNPKKYLIKILSDLMEFKQGKLILAGDFNFSIDHKIDRTSVVPDREHKQLRRIKKTNGCNGINDRNNNSAGSCASGNEDELTRRNIWESPMETK